MNEDKKIGWLWLTSSVIGITEVVAASMLGLPDWAGFITFVFMPLFIAFPVAWAAEYFEKEAES